MDTASEQNVGQSSQKRHNKVQQKNNSRRKGNVFLFARGTSADFPGTLRILEMDNELKQICNMEENVFRMSQIFLMLELFTSVQTQAFQHFRLCG